ncbi:hypothetical protein HGRIS_014912 [Hohenbuehelia grisea]
MRSKAMEADIARLDKLIQASYVRFQVVTLVDIRGTAHRALLRSAEQRDNMLRLETAFINMMVEGNSRNQSAPIWETADVTPDDLDFLARQAYRIVDAFDPRNFARANYIEPPSGHHAKENPLPPSAWGLDFDTLFSWGLTEACHASNLLVIRSNTRTLPIQRSAKALLFLADHLYYLKFGRLAALLFQRAITLYSALQTGFPCPQYQNCLAFALSAATRLSHPSERLSYNQSALDLCEDIYTRSSDPHSLLRLVEALGAHSWNLMVDGLVDGSLDMQRQLLMLSREHITMVQDWSYVQQLPVVTWSASGEADIVLSSERQPSMPSRLAYDLSLSLWIVAKCFASLGRYAEARIAGIDAIECRAACMQVEAWNAQFYPMDVDLWLGDLATWVSVHRSPRSSVYQLASSEARGTARIVEGTESTLSSSVAMA